MDAREFYAKQSRANYKTDRAWSERFAPRLRALIGPHLLVPSTLEQDQQHACDLVVFTARDLKIACRVRRYGYADSFPRQFTLRSKRDNGVPTELKKIVDGFGDWFFYGHATQDQQDICPWWIINLNAFRAHLIRDPYQKRIRMGEQPNFDIEGTWFRWFDIDSFPATPHLLIASSEE